MKKNVSLFLPVAMLFLSVSLYSQQGKPSVSKQPAWVTNNIIDYNKTLLDKDATDGYIDVAYEEQVSLADQSKYYRRSRKIISNTGVQNGSEIAVSFDPAYEKLILHSIRIIRNGESLNRLDLSKIEIVHQEKELTSFIYNGSLNAVLILEDVRRGDIIEYSYTIKGFNPIFKNKYTAEYDLQIAEPIYEMYYKLIVPAGRKMNIKVLNKSLPPVISSVGGNQVYEWHKYNIPPLTVQDNIPSWYDPYSQVLVSEFNTWKEVNEWAMEIYPAKKNLSEGLQKKINQIESAHKENAERIQTTLQFVQDDIRYMGFEMGENSHKPADPSKIFAQRFGDCKEKSYLLCCMLRAMKIDADLVLINTDKKKELNTLLPAPTAFDHVTVRVKLDSVYYYFDPTISYQRGDIKNIFYPDYQAGLILSDSTTSITPIVFHNVSFTKVKDDFKVSSMYGDGSLKVTTTFQGNAADEARRNINNSNISDLIKSYQKFYASYYDDIKGDSLTYTDNDSTGILTTTEYYSIPNFWTTDKGKGKKFSFSPFIINNVLKRPKEKDRKMPFGLAFPVKYYEEIMVDLPENWSVNESELHLKNAGYAFNSKFYCVYNHVHLIADYENYKDNVTAEEAPDYFKDLNDYDEVVNTELTYGMDGLSGKNSPASTANIVYAILIFVAMAGSMIWRRTRR